MNIVFLAADQVARNGPESDLVVLLGAGADEADVRAVGTVSGLQGVAGDRSFANRAVSAIDVNLGRRFAVGPGNFVRTVVVVFDVVTGDLKIADFAAFNANAPLAAIADV